MMIEPPREPNTNDATPPPDPSQPMFSSPPSGPGGGGGIQQPFGTHLPPVRPPAPPPGTGSQPPRDRTIIWVIVAMATGFMLPVCTCIGLILTSAFSLSSLANRLGGEEETGTAIGVIDLNGPIATGDGFGATTGHIMEQLEWMEDNDDVKALVIRGNSPGGSSSASDELWNAVREFKKPVVFYMHGTCASGCLYVASAAQEIVASRNALVGSIGVISTFFNVDELLDDIGVEVEVVVTGESKDFGSLFRDLTPEEREFWQRQSELLLNHFIQVVANREGSPLDEIEVRELATGDIWIATHALELGLIDQLGYEQDALDIAADLAGVRGSYRVQEYPYNFSFFDVFRGPGFDTHGYFALPDTQDLMESLQQTPLQYRYFGTQ